jgi:hypothetical protein
MMFVVSLRRNEGGSTLALKSKADPNIKRLDATIAL